MGVYIIGSKPVLEQDSGTGESCGESCGMFAYYRYGEDTVPEEKVSEKEEMARSEPG